MQSIRSRIFLWLLHHRHYFKLKLRQPAFNTSREGILRLREDTEKAGLKFGKIPKSILVSPISIGEMYAEWVKTPDAPVDKVILYFHGGMYLIGSPKGHRVHVAKFVKGTGINALCFDYGLAPDHPFPAGLNDALSAYLF